MSAEKDEKVVKPPKNPTVIKIFHESKFERPIKNAKKIPIKKLPKIFTVKVPRGKSPGFPAKKVVVKYLQTAPNPPPKKTKNIFVINPPSTLHNGFKIHSAAFQIIFFILNQNFVGETFVGV